MNQNKQKANQTKHKKKQELNNAKTLQSSHLPRTSR